MAENEVPKYHSWAIVRIFTDLDGMVLQLFNSKNESWAVKEEMHDHRKACHIVPDPNSFWMLDILKPSAFCPGTLRSISNTL